jgi:hypothetical protein
LTLWSTCEYRGGGLLETTLSATQAANRHGLTDTLAALRRAPLDWIILAGLVALGIRLFIGPIFTWPAPLAADALNHIALTTAARNTIADTHALPISSSAIRPPQEYPYFLFGNGAFYVVSALISTVLRHKEAYLGIESLLGIGFAAGIVGAFLLARRRGVPRYLAVALAFLYASGP